MAKYAELTDCDLADCERVGRGDGEHHLDIGVPYDAWDYFLHPTIPCMFNSLLETELYLIAMQFVGSNGASIEHFLAPQE